MANIKPLIVTFNCGRELVKPDVFSRHLVTTLCDHPSPELIILSLQEVAPIAYAFLGGPFLVPYLDQLRHAVDLAAKALGDARYISFITRNVGMTVIMAFVQEDFSGHIRWMETGGVGIGVQEMGNKGAVGLRVGYAAGDETMEMTFVAAHLAPMEDAVERRNEDWKDIIKGLVFTPVDHKAVRVATRAQTRRVANGEDEPLLPGSTDSASELTSGIYTPTSYLFLAGDLNYRTCATKPSPDDHTAWPQPAKVTHPQHYSNLLRVDQLATEKKANRTLHGLEEAAIDFPPTYKYSDVGRMHAGRIEQLVALRSSQGREAQPQGQEWLWAKHRWPSWCDRILYLDIPTWMKSKDPTAQIQIIKYTALPLMSTSDHRPVMLSLSLPLKPIPPPTDEIANGDVRVKPPFPIDPNWRERRATARRKELVVGLGSYFALTWEGRGVLFAILVGALGGWAVIRSMLEM
ncbi:hypothetical protein MMC30_004795 [Trapelia coarctata]|nr:hypothetical protein [Trapelia coarctata]